MPTHHMTQNKPGPDKRFVGSLLPWLIAAAGLIFYLLTLNRWISATNISHVASRSGWVWGLEFDSPLYYLLTYPFTWLPNAVRPLAFNLFSATCAVLTLALLARSVTLLPHDRTVAQRQRERSRTGVSLPVAWIPPVLAAAVLGLQLTFWEGATAGSSELLEVLLLAYAVRNVLEYRVSKNESWLLRGSLAWGAGMANGWMIFCLFPGFLIMLFWVRGLSFFNARFMFRMFLCGVAGLLLYLVLPLIHMASANRAWSFWAVLKANLAYDKNAFLFFSWRAPLNVRLSLAMASLLPVLLIGIRWPTNFGDTSRLGGILAKWILHLAHAALMVACIWVAFDPAFSPRGLGYPLAALAYLAALSIGYFAGYFLLVFKALPDRMGRPSTAQKWCYVASRTVVWLMLVLVPTGLLWRNLPEIRMSNGPALKDYASRLVEALPPKAAVLCDDDRKLVLAQGILAMAGREKDYLFMDTQRIMAPGYHAFQTRRYGSAWPAVVDPSRTNRVEDLEIVYVASKLIDKMPLCYLNPSFGYYFEFFDQRPRGLSYELVAHSTNSVAGPPLSEAETTQNEQFWAQATPSLERLSPWITPSQKATSFGDVLLQKMHIPREPNRTAVILGNFYSQALDFWGVKMQRTGQLPAAHRCFQLATELNPDNVSARGNLKFNEELLAGKKPALDAAMISESNLGRYHDWQQVLQAGGPSDEPMRCFGLGILFIRGNLIRQGGIELERVHQLIPGHLPTRLTLASIYTRFGLPEKALELVQGLSSQKEALANEQIRGVDAFQAETIALYSTGHKAQADELVRTAFKEHASEQDYLAAITQVSSMFRVFTNALSALAQLEKLRPEDPTVLVSEAYIHIQLAQPSNAVPVLTHVLELQETNYTARLYRAIAYTGTGQLQEADQDYRLLLAQFPRAVEVNSGLAELALKRNDTNAALRYYDICLTNTAAGSEQRRILSQRIKELRPPNLSDR